MTKDDNNNNKKPTNVAAERKQAAKNDVQVPLNDDSTLMEKIVMTRLSIHQSDDEEEQLREIGVLKPPPAVARLPSTAKQIAKYAMDESSTNNNNYQDDDDKKGIARYAIDESEKGPDTVRLQRNANKTVPSQPGAYRMAHPDATSTDDDIDEEDWKDPSGPLLPEEIVPLDAKLVEETVPSEKSNNSNSIPDCNNGSDHSLTIEGKAVEEEEEPARTKTWLGIVMLMLVVILLLSLGLSGVFNKASDPSQSTPSVKNTGVMTADDPLEETVSVPTTDLIANASSISSLDTRSTLQRIRDEGVLKCGYRHLPVANGDIEGFLGVLCEAVAAAIFGTNSANRTIPLPGTNTTIDRTVPVEYVKDTHGSIFDTLHSKQIHLKTFGYTHNMERNVFRQKVQSGFHFGIPYLYEGMRLAGDPFFVQCAENKLDHLGDCQELKICVGNHSTYHTRLQQLLPRRNIAVMPFIGQINHGLVEGECNLLAGSSFLMATEATIREAGYSGEYTVSDGFFSKEPVAIVTRPDGAEWSDFVNAIVMSLLVAEQEGIAQETALESMPTTHLFGDDYKDMFKNAVAYAGNFGQIYNHLLQEGVPRASLNWINNGTTGLLYAHPLGDFEVDRGDVPLSEGMNRILEEGVVRCGIRCEDRAGFCKRVGEEGYVGMEVDYCRAISASLFGGSTTNVEYVELTSQQDGYQKLNEGTIDVFLGATWTLETDVREPTTGVGFAFTKPYFYGYSAEEDNLAIATRQDDHDWSTFVLWSTVMATIHAEEEEITSASSNDMPEVFLFGSALKRMFRNVVLAVGNYGDIYERNVEAYIPRAGRNRLNTNPHLAGQHYILPGFL